MSLLSINCTTVVQRLYTKIVPGVDEEALWLEKAIKSLAKKLRKTHQLEEFETVLQTKSPLSRCITLLRSLDGRLQIAHRKVLPHVVFCRLFRWADLHSYHELKSLSNCQYGFHKKQQLLCINPYHFYRAELLIMPPICVPKVSKLKQQEKTQEQKDVRKGRYMNGTTSFPMNGVSTQGCNYNGYLQQFPSLENGMEICRPLYQGFNNIQSFNISPIMAPISLITDNAKVSLCDQIINLIPSNNSYGKSDKIYSINIYDNLCANPNINFKMHNQKQHEPMITTGKINSANNNDNFIDLQRHIDEQVLSSIYPALNNFLNFNENRLGLDTDYILVNYETCKYWCEISYYEFGRKIGNAFSSNSKTITIDFSTGQISPNVFGLQNYINNNKNDEFCKTRSSLNSGIRLTHGGGEVMIECLCKNSAIFISSPNFTSKNILPDETVVRLERGDSISVFDYHDFAPLLANCISQSYESVYKLLSWTVIRVSFIKGWGANFKRRNPDETPLWFEIKLIGPLTWLDRVMRQLVAPVTKCSSMT